MGNIEMKTSSPILGNSGASLKELCFHITVKFSLLIRFRQSVRLLMRITAVNSFPNPAGSPFSREARSCQTLIERHQRENRSEEQNF